MSHHYQRRSQSAEHFSHSQYESESESESESECEEQQEQQEPQWRQRCSLPPSRDTCLSQRGAATSAGAGGACRPQLAQENYYAQLNRQYYRALALEGRTSPMSSKPKPNKWEEESGCTCSNGTIEYAPNNNYDLTSFSQDDHMVPISSKLTTPKKGEEEHNYAYYESKIINNGWAGHTRNNNKDLKYISQEGCIASSSSKPTLNKGKMQSEYVYNESEFDNNERVGYVGDNISCSYDTISRTTSTTSTTTSSTIRNGRFTYM